MKKKCEAKITVKGMEPKGRCKEPTLSTVKVLLGQKAILYLAIATDVLDHQALWY